MNNCTSLRMTYHLCMRELKNTWKSTQMQSIKITFLSFIASITGEKITDINITAGTTIEQLLEMLVSRYGQEFEDRVYNIVDGLNRFVMVLVNGIDMRSLNGLETILEPGCEIQLLPAIAGG